MNLENNTLVLSAGAVAQRHALPIDCLQLQSLQSDGLSNIRILALMLFTPHLAQAVQSLNGPFVAYNVHETAQESNRKLCTNLPCRPVFANLHGDRARLSSTSLPRSKYSSVIATAAQSESIDAIYGSKSETHTTYMGQFRCDVGALQRPSPVCVATANDRQ